MGIFVSTAKTIECVVIAVAFAFALFIVSFRSLGILQSCGYGNKKFIRWLKKKNNLTFNRLSVLALACLLSSAVVALCFSFAGEWAAVISLVAFLAFFVLYAYADNRTALRCPVALTPRFKRLSVVVWLVFAVIGYLFVTLLNFADAIWGNALFSTLRYCALAALPLLLIPLVCLAGLISAIYEIPHSKGFIKKAKAKIAASQIKVVGITGSYGKTSAKNILQAMLSRKYRVLSTPRSHNTPLGLSLAINNNDLNDYEIFIAEMGARNIGDIAELCALCPPDYSLITGVCSQHLESFSSLENIVKAKGEIISATANACFIADDCYELFRGINGDKVRCDCVSDVISDYKGTSFTLTLGGKEFSVRCKLLGAHSAYNIGLCAQAAYALGVPPEEIAAAAESLDFVEHRLQLIENNGVFILDDGYNSNVKGAEAAISVLRSFPDRKIVVTPGLVELGVLEEKENAALGAKLVGLDLVILVGDTLVGAVKSGYLEAGGDAGKLIVVPSLKDAQEMLKEAITVGAAVLFLNDLPDVY